MLLGWWWRTLYYAQKEGTSAKTGCAGLEEVGGDPLAYRSLHRAVDQPELVYWPNIYKPHTQTRQYHPVCVCVCVRNNINIAVCVCVTAVEVYCECDLQAKSPPAGLVARGAGAAP